MKHLVLSIGSGLGSRRTIAASAAVAAALLVSSVVAAAPAAKVPKRWHGTALYTYTYTGDDGSVQQTMNASVVLVPARVRGWTNTYQVSTGTIKWDYKQQTSDGCTLTSSGSYRATKYHLVLQLQRGRRPRAFFSGQEGGASDYPTATITCPDGTSETITLGSGIGNPFFIQNLSLSQNEHLEGESAAELALEGEREPEPGQRVDEVEGVDSAEQQQSHAGS